MKAHPSVKLVHQENEKKRNQPDMTFPMHFYIKRQASHPAVKRLYLRPIQMYILYTRTKGP